MFVAAGHELEEQVRGVLLEGQVADLVDDDERSQSLNQDKRRRFDSYPGSRPSASHRG